MRKDRETILLFLAISLVLCRASINCYEHCLSLTVGRLARMVRLPPVTKLTLCRLRPDFSGQCSVDEFDPVPGRQNASRLQVGQAADVGGGDNQRRTCHQRRQLVVAQAPRQIRLEQ